MADFEPGTETWSPPSLQASEEPTYALLAMGQPCRPPGWWHVYIRLTNPYQRGRNYLHPTAEDVKLGRQGPEPRPGKAGLWKPFLPVLGALSGNRTPGGTAVSSTQNKLPLTCKPRSFCNYSLLPRLSPVPTAPAPASHRG